MRVGVWREVRRHRYATGVARVCDETGVIWVKRECLLVLR